MPLTLHFLIPHSCSSFIIIIWLLLEICPQEEWHAILRISGLCDSDFSLRINALSSSYGVHWSWTDLDGLSSTLCSVDISATHTYSSGSVANSCRSKFLEAHSKGGVRTGQGSCQFFAVLSGFLGSSRFLWYVERVTLKFAHQLE